MIIKIVYLMNKNNNLKIQFNYIMIEKKIFIIIIILQLNKTLCQIYISYKLTKRDGKRKKKYIKKL